MVLLKQWTSYKTITYSYIYQNIYIYIYIYNFYHLISVAYLCNQTEFINIYLSETIRSETTINEVFIRQTINSNLFILLAFHINKHFWWTIIIINIIPIINIFIISSIIIIIIIKIICKTNSAKQFSSYQKDHSKHNVCKRQHIKFYKC